MGLLQLLQLTLILTVHTQAIQATLKFQNVHVPTVTRQAKTYACKTVNTVYPVTTASISITSHALPIQYVLVPTVMLPPEMYAHKTVNIALPVKMDTMSTI